MISVIIPAYNSAAYLGDALKSIFSQTNLPCEILVVDDCSSDETCSIVKRFQAISPVDLRLIRLEQNSGGPVTPMNRGIHEARGTLIALLDHDDMMVPIRLELGAKLLLTSDRLGIVFGQSQGMDTDGTLDPPHTQSYARFGTQTAVMPATQALKSLLSEGYGYGGAGGMMFRKTTWEQVGGFRSLFKICWDYDFAFRATLAGWDVGYLPEIVCHHRRHQNNLEASGEGQHLYLEISELFEDISNDPRMTNEQRRLLQKLQVSRALTAAQQQRSRGNYEMAQQFYLDAWQQKSQRLQVLRGMLKNWWLSWRKP